MNTEVVDDRFKLIVRTVETDRRNFAEDVARGLSGEQKSIPCTYFYDHKGSLLFEDICALEEYYLTRAEREILESRSDEIAAFFQEGAGIVELGSGSSKKTRLLIESFLRKHGELRYDPIDISREMIEGSSISLLKRYPDLEILAVASDYADGLELLNAEDKSAKLILWLGSSVGNLDRDEAARFLGKVRASMGVDDRLLIGIDLRKSKEVLERAYDDREGITARFNLNVLNRINDELGGNFDLGSFAHRSSYDAKNGFVEMHLVSDKEQTVRIDAIDRDFEFDKGETIRTERSYKYSSEEIETLLERSGLETVRWWLDSQDRFSLTLAAPAA